MDTIKFIDLHPQLFLRSKLGEAYDRVFNSSSYIGGKEVEAFEEAWAEYCDAKYCVAVGNGHDALALSCSFMSKDVYPALRPTITVPWKTCLPTWAASRNGNCSPVLENQSGMLSMAVHIYGRITLPKTYTKDSLVEDCAQAHGAKFNNTKAGKFGRVAAWSFYPTKNLGALGDAGAITTDDMEVAEYIRERRNYGTRDNLGVNSRLDPLQAAFLRVKLGYLDAWNERRRNNAIVYYQEIFNPRVELPFLDFYDSPCWHIFAIEVDDRDSLRKYLADNGVETMIHYPTIPYPSYWKSEEAEAWTKRTLSLPVAPHITPHICKCIAELINKWGDNNDN